VIPCLRTCWTHRTPSKMEGSTLTTHTPIRTGWTMAILTLTHTRSRTIRIPMMPAQAARSVNARALLLRRTMISLRTRSGRHCGPLCETGQRKVPGKGQLVTRPSSRRWRDTSLCRGGGSEAVEKCWSQDAGSVGWPWRLLQEVEGVVVDTE
jgi:hypothetical protein